MFDTFLNTAGLILAGTTASILIGIGGWIMYCGWQEPKDDLPMFFLWVLIQVAGLLSITAGLIGLVGVAKIALDLFS